MKDKPATGGNMFKFDDERSYTMPAYFGGSLRTVRHEMKDCLGILVSCKVDGEEVSRFLPEGFALTAEALKVSFFEARDVDWLKGGGFSCLSLSVPVRYEGNDEGLDGDFPLVIWQNRIESLYRAREAGGLPALYMPIPQCESCDGRITVEIGAPGSAILRLSFAEEDPLSDSESELFRTALPVRTFGWRYIPNTGAPGAALSHATLIPCRSSFSGGIRGTAEIDWLRTGFAFHPEQEHVLTALAGLYPVVTQAVSGTGCLHVMPELSRPLP